MVRALMSRCNNDGRSAWWRPPPHPRVRAGGGGPAAELIDTGPGPGRAWDPVQVVGGPGTGKTSLLIDVAVARLRAGSVGAGSVLVLTPGARSARRVRASITAGLVGSRARTVREPLVRTVHSYAFSVLRLQAARAGNPPPRLITGPEQDAVVRELLRGEIADGARAWPSSLAPALGLHGFAAELRELLLRATELGLGPEELVRLGRLRTRPEWVAAGRFWRSYERSTLLRASVGMQAPQASAPAVDAAGLISSALDALHADTVLLTGERARVRHLLVDDAQHLDPGAAALVRLLGITAETVLAGDADQSVFGFRGADPTFFTELSPTRRVRLGTTHRCAPAVARAVAAIEERLPGRRATEGPRPVAGSAAGSVDVHVLGTVAQEAALVADTLRRAHLSDGVDYSEMAVIVRSLDRSLAPLRRALLAAGVPLTVPVQGLPLARQHSVAGFLLAVQALTAPQEFTAEQALALLACPLGGADPVALRRLRRGLRRAELAAGGDRDSAVLLREALLSAEQAPGAGLTDAEARPLRRVRAVLSAAAEPVAAHKGVEEVLWALWRASGLQRRWVAAAERGGTAGAQADRDLDHVVALFDAAARYVDRLPRADVAGFVGYLTDQEIPADTRSDAAPAGEAVSVLTAHAAAGRQWRLVMVAGVQERLWPSVRARGSLLGIEQLVEEVTGGPGPALADVVSRAAPLLAEERRLFLVACSRAAQRLVVTAVRNSSADAELEPSRFLDELGVGLTAGEPPSSWEPERRRRALVLGELVAELRSVVCDPVGPAPRRDDAARHLARLAAAGVPGAHPDSWYGLAGAPVPTAGAIELSKDAITVTPSSVELLSTCPLRWFLERHGGQDGSAVAAVTGTLVHTLVQAIAGHTPARDVDAALARTWNSVDVGAPWFAEHELERTRAMLDTFRAWWEVTRTQLREVAVEVEVDATVSGEVGGRSVDARITGRIDRLERDEQGRLVVIDVKTGKTVATEDAATEHAQLATYQLAAAQGAVVDHAGDATPGGARLVYVAKRHGKTGACERRQGRPRTTPPSTGGASRCWRRRWPAGARVSPRRSTTGVSRCPVRAACPAHESGRQVGGG